MVSAGDLSKISLNGKIAEAQGRCEFKADILGQIARCGFESQLKDHMTIKSREWLKRSEIDNGSVEIGYVAV